MSITIYVLQNKCLKILLQNHVLNTFHSNFEQVCISCVGEMHIYVLQVSHWLVLVFGWSVRSLTFVGFLLSRLKFSAKKSDAWLKFFGSPL